MDYALLSTPNSLRELADQCRDAGRFALDTEADSLHSYFHKVCLIQVTVGGRNILIDSLAVEGEALAPLWQVIADPAITVLMHGSDYDLRVLDRDFGVRFSNLQDTQIMAQILGEKRTGLAALLEKELGISLDKKFQRADWGRRPLRSELLEYAASDTAYLDDLVIRLRARLEELGRWSWALEDCDSLTGVRYEEPRRDPHDFERIKGARKLKGAARDRLFTLYQWREDAARSKDLPPFKIVGPRQMLDLAIEAPQDVKAIIQTKGLGRRFAQRYGRRVLSLLERPQKAPERKAPIKPPSPSAESRKRVRQIFAVRDEFAEKLELTPSLLCTKAQAEAIACFEPSPESLSDLETTGLTGWRLELLGTSILEGLGNQS